MRQRAARSIRGALRRSRVARVTRVLVRGEPVSIRPGVVPGQHQETENIMSNETNRPTHGIFQVIGDDSKAIWLRVGAAWLHKDTRGAQIVLNSVPLTGRLVMRELT